MITKNELRGYHCFNRKYGSRNRIYKVQLENEIWYLKEHRTKITPYTEILAQEFFRLIIPGQPKTRMVKSGDQIYTASKEIAGFTSLGLFFPENTIKQHLDKNLHTKLGEIVVVALLLCELDLTSNNIGIDTYGNFVKLDGEFSFGYLFHAEIADEDNKFAITANVLDKLPYIKDYIINFFNRTIFWEKDLQKIASHTGFRREINFAILKIITLPNEFLAQFINQYKLKHSKTFYKALIARISLLRNAAYKNQSFQSFISNDKFLEDDFRQYLLYLESFNTILSEKMKEQLINHKNDVLKQAKLLDSSYPYNQERINPVSIELTTKQKIDFYNKIKTAFNNYCAEKSAKFFTHESRRTKPIRTKLKKLLQEKDYRALLITTEKALGIRTASRAQRLAHSSLFRKKLHTPYTLFSQQTITSSVSGLWPIS